MVHNVQTKLKKYFVSQIALRIVHVPMNPSQITDGVIAALRSGNDVIQLSVLGAQPPPSDSANATLLFPKSGDLYSAFQLIDPLARRATMVLGPRIKEALLGSILPVDRHLVVIAVLPFFVLRLNGSGVRGVSGSPAWLATHADTISAATVAGKVTHRTLRLAFRAGSQFVLTWPLQT